jgi:hypothetical protein
MIVGTRADRAEIDSSNTLSAGRQERTKTKKKKAIEHDEPYRRMDE